MTVKLSTVKLIKKNTMNKDRKMNYSSVFLSYIENLYSDLNISSSYEANKTSLKRQDVSSNT
jgi:hypothetical protein